MELIEMVKDIRYNPKFSKEEIKMREILANFHDVII